MTLKTKQPPHVGPPNGGFGSGDARLADRVSQQFSSRGVAATALPGGGIRVALPEANTALIDEIRGTLPAGTRVEFTVAATKGQPLPGEGGFGPPDQHLSDFERSGRARGATSDTFGSVDHQADAPSSAPRRPGN